MLKRSPTQINICMFNKNTTLCCFGPRCPVVTQTGADSYNVTDDYNHSDMLTASDLTELSMLGKRHSPTTTVRFRNLQMLAEQAALASTAI